MGILDLALMNDREKPKQPETPNTTNTNVVNTQHTSPTPTSTDSVIKERTIYVDGPISNIITHALNITYANVDKDTSLLADDNIITKPANEEAAIDSTLVAGIYAAVNKDSVLGQARDTDVYVYATNDENLDDPNVQLGDLSVALSKCKAKKKILVMESMSLNNTKVAVLTAYAREKGFDIFYTREKLLREL